MSAPRLPNIVFFTWHDAGDWFGCYGHQTVQTPHVDRLAAEGVRLTQMHSACAICSPSRAAMMTGRFCQENGVMGLTNTVFSNRIHPHIPHLGARLKELGYHRALFGVQHECAHDHVAEVIQPDEQFATDPWPRGDLLAPYVRDWLAGRRREEGPFYAQIGTIDAHLGRCFTNRPPDPGEAYTPLTDTSRGLAEPPYLSGSEADRTCVATLQGQLRRGDLVMGAVLEGLAAAGLEEETLVIMQVDHGVGLDRAKTTCYDPGTKVASIFRWPGKLPAGSAVKNLATHVDVLPTLWELLGQEPIAGLDGHSFAGHLRGERTGEFRQAVFSHMVENTRSIRTQTHKLIRHFAPSRHSNGRKGDCAHLHQGFPTPMGDREIGPHTIPSAEWPSVEMFDLQEDPLELNNLAQNPTHAEQTRELDAQLWEFLLKHRDFLVTAPVRTPWDASIRAEMTAHCECAGRPLPYPAGPSGNPIDAASQEGKGYRG